MDTVWQDVRYGARMLARNPGFTLVATLSFALGIGANSTIFSALHATIFRVLPYQDPDRLVLIWGKNVSSGGGRNAVAPADFLDWRAQQSTFQQFALVEPGSHRTTLNDSGSAERVSFQRVSPDLFPLLGVNPLMGRHFAAEEIHQGNDSVMLSYEFWQRRYGGDAAVVGRKITVRGAPVTVAGIMPPAFEILGGNGTDIWQALNLASGQGQNRKIPWLAGVGRLKPAGTLVAAQTELSAIAARLEQAYPDTNKGRGVVLDPLSELFADAYKSTLYPLFGVTGFVLLIACANVAGLLLSRSAARRKELVMRAAVGAGRGRLVRQLLTEGTLLALLGGLFGVAVAFAGIRMFAAFAPSWLPTRDLGINAQVLAFTFAVTVCTGVLAALAPAVQAARQDLNNVIKEGARSVASGSHGLARKTLVIAEVALALVLLAGSGLMIRSFLGVVSVNPGFDPRELVTMHIDLTGPRYVEWAPDGEGSNLFSIHPTVEPFYDRVLEHTRALPGIQSASLVSWLPIGFGSVGPRARQFRISGRPTLPPTERPFATYNMVDPDYFRTMRIPLRKGRYLTEQDAAQSPWAAVINESMARRFWRDEDPIGQALTIATIDAELPRTVVGVVGDVRQQSLTQEANPEIYTSFRQQPAIYGDGWQNRLHRILVARTSMKPESLATAVRENARNLDPDQPVYDAFTMEQVLARSAAPWRLYMILLGVFAGVALLLASIGLYGLIAYSVSERTQEIGIRMAVGAAQHQVLRMVLKQGMRLVLIGLAIGLAGSLALTRLIAFALYGVTPTDAVTLAAVCGVLAAVSLAAVFWPAYRASRIDPLHALRSE
ncbi:MAG: ABC transporter permease [Bryobacteraceae bacterium]